MDWFRPNEWKDGCIYIICSPNTDKVFIGSTRALLNDCLTSHKASFKAGKNRPSKDVISAGDVYIKLLEKYPCYSKAELTEREQIVKQNYIMK